jgi:hypothetical protein
VPFAARWQSRCTCFRTARYRLRRHLPGGGAMSWPGSTCACCRGIDSSTTPDAVHRGVARAPVAGRARRYPAHAAGHGIPVVQRAEISRPGPRPPWGPGSAISQTDGGLRARRPSLE